MVFITYWNAKFFLFVYILQKAQRFMVALNVTNIGVQNLVRKNFKFPIRIPKTS